MFPLMKETLYKLWPLALAFEYQFAWKATTGWGVDDLMPPAAKFTPAFAGAGVNTNHARLRVPNYGGR